LEIYTNDIKRLDYVEERINRKGKKRKQRGNRPRKNGLKGEKVAAKRQTLGHWGASNKETTALSEQHTLALKRARRGPSETVPERVWVGPGGLRQSRLAFLMNVETFPEKEGKCIRPQGTGPKGRKLRGELIEKIS